MSPSTEVDPAADAPRFLVPLAPSLDLLSDPPIALNFPWEVSIFSPAVYFYVSISQKDKRTDYPGKEISNAIQEKWDNNFKNTIKSVIGDEWHAGNLSYHLETNPRWYSFSNAFVEISVDDFIETIGKEGFIIVNGECSRGILFVIKNINICMNGNK